MRSERAKRVLFAVVAVSVLVGALWRFALPEVVRRYAERALVKRLHVGASVSLAHVALGRVELEGLVVAGENEGVRLRVERVAMDCSPVTWLWQGGSACRSARVEGVDADVNVSAPGFQRWMEGLRERNRADAGRRNVSRSVRVERLAGQVRDESGLLVSFDGARIVSNASTLAMSVSRLDVGGEDSERWTCAGLDVALSREAGLWQLGMVSVRSGRVVAGASEDGAPPTGSSAASTRERLRIAFGRGVLAAVPRASATAAHSMPADESAAGRWLAHVADRARFWVGDVVVANRGPMGESDVVRRLHGAIVREPGNVFRTWGTGTGVPSGMLHWDLEVRPSELRGEGAVRMVRLPLAMFLPFFPTLTSLHAGAARVDADVAVRAEGLDRLSLAGNVDVSGAVLESSRIAPAPVRGLAVGISGRASFVPSRRRLEVHGARLSLDGAGPASGGSVAVALDGALEWGSSGYLVDVNATLPTTPCGVAVGAIPADLLADLAGFRLAGTLAGRLRVHVDAADLEATKVEVHVDDDCEFEAVPMLADLRRFTRPFEHRVVEPDDTEFVFETGPGSAAWTPISEISPFLPHAVMAHEDGGFLRHHGFAPSEIQVALVRNLRAGRYVQGASTITMQLVKNVFLHREKTLARKVQEVLLTWWIERVLDKEKILELYLNVIEYGPAIYGVRSAASHYFGREPRELSVGESAFLAMILPSPKLFHQAYEDGEPSPRLRDRLRGFLRRLASRGRIDEVALAAGLAEIDVLAFHREGAEPPPPRVLVGSTEPLPFGLPEVSAAGWSDVTGDDGAEPEAAWQDDGAASWSSDGE